MIKSINCIMILISISSVENLKRPAARTSAFESHILEDPPWRHSSSCQN